jgi:hypothetical protein
MTVITAKIVLLDFGLTFVRMFACSNDPSYAILPSNSNTLMPFLGDDKMPQFISFFHI